MTTGRNDYDPTFLASPSTQPGFSLPFSQELRLRKSFENLCSLDSSEDAVKSQDMMDTSLPDELPPDYETVDSNRPLDYCTDLSTLPHLTEEAVFRVIRDRYRKDQIFTRCGDVLISVNPFKQLDIFDKEAHETYCPDSLARSAEPEPHLFWLAAQAVARRQREKVNQVVLVSGESGAGKTEATKLMLQHILHLSSSQQDRLYESIDKVNPLIELFGNARTQLNDNSSRFAKFLDVRFSKDGSVTGAIIRDYILEKSRVISPSEGESNFHIFYTFLDDVLSDRSRQKMFLMDGMKKTDFRILPPSSWRRSANRMNSEDQAKVMTKIGLKPLEVENMQVILAAILHLTNIQFEEVDNSTGGVVVENEDTMRKAAALLNVNEEQLVRVLVSKKTKFAGNEIEMFKSMAKAEETRDAMAKALYERLFGWLIRTINMALNRYPSAEAGIGFLDICGFENLGHNSLEQLCINLANEHLQKFMNTQVFEQEMKVYQQEEIQLEDVHPPTNEPILHMFEMKKTGILALINEDTRVEMATDTSMVGKLVACHESEYFLRNRRDELRFGITHFAAQVWYDADQFLEKNGDALSKEVKDVLVASRNELVSDIFQVEKAPTGSIAPTQYKYRVSQKHPINFPQPGQTKLSESVMHGLRQSLHERFKGRIPSMKDTERSRISDQRTVIDCFQASMKELLEKMRKAQALFVRCIKPNDDQAPDQFEDAKVQRQLRYNGVTQIARIRRVWFPVRLTYKDFILRYCHTAPESKAMEDKREAAFTILRHVGAATDHVKMGRTLIFLKDQVAATLDSALERQKEEQRKKKEEEEKRQKEEERKRIEEAEERRSAERQEKLLKVVDTSRKRIPAFDPNALDTVVEVPTPSSSRRSTLADLPSSSSNSTETAFSSASSSSSSSPANEGASVNQGTESSNSSAEKTEDSKNNFWDIFRIVAREQDREDIHNMTVMKIIKLIAYVLIFLIVLLTSTAQKVSLMIVLAAMKVTDAKNDDSMAVSTAYYILMMVAICLPYILTFLVSMAKVAFGGFRNPSVGTWIWVFVTESLHTLGLTLLVFRVLPRLDVVHGLLFLTAVGIIPAILKLVTSVDVRRDHRKTHCGLLKRTTEGVLDFLAFAGQVSAIPMIYVMDYVSTNEDGVWSVLDVAGAMLVSVGCWENFLDSRFFVQLGDMNPVKNFLLKRRFDLQRGRYIPQLIMSAWKIALTTVLAYFYRGERNFDYEKAFDTLGKFHSEWKLVTAILVLTLSAGVCYYFAYIACKLWMQKLSFVIPLTLSTPCAILVFFLDQQYHFLTSVTETHRTGDVSVTWPDDLLSHWRTLVPGVAWFVSLLLLTRHVWHPRQSRLAKFEMLFMNPLYCGILTSETLLLNRRRHTLSCRKKWLSDTLCFYKLDTKEKRAQGHPDYVDDTYTEIGQSEETYDPENPYASMTYGGGRTKEGDEEIPMIYACATMWHEVRREMVALLKSLHRIDREQWTRRQAQEISGTKDKDYFEYEAHIFFDDAMTLDDDEEFIPNDYVKMVVDVMEEAVSSVYKKTMTVSPPIKIPTPYGGQLLWIMPGDNLLFIHLKDKTKIRHRKRWSQVMYMYYLLGFRLTRQCQEQIIEALKAGKVDERTSWSLDRNEVVGSDIFEMLDEKVAKQSQNTFVMALDGDTDFSPGSVHILLDRMKKNPKVAAACGRIHPIGSGPLVWYQMFEYAIGHWMQKATEHVLGCVLCSPGCFSLFRGSALMDDNVMRKYTILPTEPGHFLQYDQGEDRWLCTLLLQQGYRVDYAAAADAWTYAPEGFNEFFNQRRRWMPSTLANVMDLLGDYSNTVAVNSNISMLYIIYQVALMVATLLGPGTVLMMIAGAIGVVFKVDLIWSYVVAMVPAVIYLGVCLKCKTNIQLYLAALLSTFYAFVMMIVFVGVIVTAARESIFHPSVLVIIFLILIFVIAGLCHPMEMFCLPSGALYLLCIPSGYLLLVIYSLCNLHVVSWGTREAPKKKTKAELEQEKLEAEEKEQEKAKKKGFFSKFFFSSYLNELKEIIQSATGQAKAQTQEAKSLEILQQINENLLKLAEGRGGTASDPKEKGKSGKSEAGAAVSLEDVKVVAGAKAEGPAETKGKGKGKKTVTIAPEPEKPKIVRNELENPKWIEDKDLGHGDMMRLFDEELDFWKAFLKKYLAPLVADKEKEKEMSEQLIDLRNSVCFGFSMINLLWIAINFMFQYTVAVPVTIPIDGGMEVGILGLLFVIFLLAILLLQIFGMILHRWGTLLHLLAFTDIDCPCLANKKVGSMRDQNDKNFQRAFDFCRRIIEEPLPDYLEDDVPLGGATGAQTAQEIIRRTILGTSHRVERQTVVQQLNQAGALERNFISSRGVNLYLRGTSRARDEEDQDAARFVSDLRTTLHDRRPNRYARNGEANRPVSDLGGPPKSPRGDGFAPPPPRRQNSAYHGGVRRRINANNLRDTVRDTIQRYQRDSGKTIPPGRWEPDQGSAVGGRRNAELRGGHHAGVMDRALSLRLQMFSDFSQGPGRDYGHQVRNV